MYTRTYCARTILGHNLGLKDMVYNQTGQLTRIESGTQRFVSPRTNDTQMRTQDLATKVHPRESPPS